MSHEPKSYIEIIAQNYPGYDVSTVGSTYDEIDWNEPSTPISKVDLDNAILEDCKTRKIEELSQETNSLIVAGFQSNALDGTTWRTYDSGEVDQLNLMGAIQVAETLGAPIAYASRLNPTDVTKSYDNHTNIQLRTVLAHGAQVKSEKLLAFNVARSQVAAITITTTLEDACIAVDAISLA